MRKPYGNRAFRKDETRMKITIKVLFTAAGHTVEITVEPPP